TAGIPLATDEDDEFSPGYTTFQSWQITGGTGAAIFAIDAATGKITVKDNSAIDFETDTTYTLTLTVSDGVHTSLETEVVIKISNENDNTPAVTPAQVVEVSENATLLDILGKIKATDADDTNEEGFTIFQKWQLVGGTGSATFDVDAATGE